MISEEAKRRAKNYMKLKDVRDVESSVEWLFKQLWETQKDKLNWFAILEKAEEMHKKEIVEAFNSGQGIPPFVFAEKYYKEVFKNEGVNEGVK
jgi:phosphoribosylaminoimidazole (AIR) synthetase